MNYDDLLPCPFCGSTNLRYEFAGSQGFIECSECGTVGPCDERAADPICDYDAAYAAWNRRAAAQSGGPAVPEGREPAIVVGEPSNRTRRVCIWSPTQMAECGGPCWEAQDPSACDCGALWMAVPEGREPASVVEQPSDEELLATLDKATATFPPRHPEAEALNAVEYPLKLELRKARAVLARFGTQQ